MIFDSWQLLIIFPLFKIVYVKLKYKYVCKASKVDIVHEIEL